MAGTKRRARARRERTYAPVGGFGRHADGVKVGGVEIGRLGVEGVDEAVNAGVGGGLGCLEGGEGEAQSGGEEEALGGGEDAGARVGEGVVAGEVVAEVARVGLVAARGIGIELEFPGDCG